jgi:hypothetical protein
VLAGSVFVGACGPADEADQVAVTGEPGRSGNEVRVGEDEDGPTPEPPVPQLEKGCATRASIQEARRMATGSALAMVDRVAPTSLADLSESGATVLSGRIVGVGQGDEKPLDLSDHLAGSADADPQVQLMADILLQVDGSREVVAVPFTVMTQVPADDAFAEHRTVTHANLVNELRCALPTAPAAVFVTRIETAKVAGEAHRRADLPTVLWASDPAAVLLQTRDHGLASLDASIPLGDASYFTGATTIPQLLTKL